jgi:hypothetical protein
MWRLGFIRRYTLIMAYQEKPPHPLPVTTREPPAESTKTDFRPDCAASRGSSSRNDSWISLLPICARKR